MKKMKKRNWKRITAAVCAAVLCMGCASALPASAVSAVPVDAVDAQAGELKTRNVHIRMDGVNTWESEHFKFYWGNSGDSSRVTESFLQENAKNLEACWNVYMNDLAMNPPTQSVNESFRDGNEYKVNFYIHNTGLLDEGGNAVPTDWAYMGYDREGYAFMFCCVDAMQNDPNPSWVLPHEFGHVVTAHQYGWNDNAYVQAWWEAIANWYREQFLYSDYYQQWAGITGITDYFETYMKNLCFTPILGRDNYASWAFLEYLAENPDNLGKYGSSFIRDLMQQGQPNEYPYKEIERIGGADIKDTLGHYAKRLATLDFKQQAAYRARQDQLLAAGEWNWGEIYTILDQSATRQNYYTVPTERAPQQFGVNIIPLAPTGNTVTVSLEGLTNAAGADWRACIAVEQRDGTTRYSDLFAAGGSASMTFDASTDAAAYLTVTATPDSSAWQEVGVAWAYSTGEFDENHYPFLGKPRYPYAVTIEGAQMKQEQDNTAAARGSRHENGGGFVASTAKVDASVYVGPNARVLGYATVSGNARIDDHAIVTGSAAVSGNAVVTGHAVVAERAQVKDNAIIGDCAGVMGNAVISENARVLESGLVFNNFRVSGNATVKGVSYCLSGGSASGQGITDGDFYQDSENRAVTAGTVFGWTCPDSYVANRPYTDGQLAGLEFSEDSAKIAADTYTSTYGVSVGDPEWAPERTSGLGVLTFGKDQYMIADSSYAALHDGEYQTAVLLRGDGSIFRFGTGEHFLELAAEDRDLVLTYKEGDTTEQLKAPDCIVSGCWATIRVIFSEDTAKLIVDNGSGPKEFTGAFSHDPVDAVREGAVYTVGEGMTGSMDYFRVNFKAVTQPEYYYTATEEVTDPPLQEFHYYYGDLDRNDIIDIFDLALLKHIILQEPSAFDELSDCDGNGMPGVGDIIAMQKYLLNLPDSGKTGEEYVIWTQS